MFKDILVLEMWFFFLTVFKYMHIGKRHNLDICPEVKVDTWDEVIIKHEGKHEVQEQYIGREAMKSVKDKKYLGSILSHDMKNSLNIKEKNG